MIDRIRHDIQQRLDQLLAEAEKLRRALAALDPRERPVPASAKPKTPLSNPAAKGPTHLVDASDPTQALRPTSATSGADGRATTRTAPGATRAKVLAALSTGKTQTAADVAKATGLARPTVSTTLSRLAKTGVIAKADRGYRLPTATSQSEPETDRA